MIGFDLGVKSATSLFREKDVGFSLERPWSRSVDEEGGVASEPCAASREANRGHLRHYHEHRDVMRALIEAAAVNSRFRDVWWKMRIAHRERFLHSLARGGSGDDPLLTRLASEAMACMVEQAAYVWFAHDSLEDVEIPIDTAAAVLTDGWYRLFFNDDGSRRAPAAHVPADAQAH